MLRQIRRARPTEHHRGDRRRTDCAPLTALQWRALLGGAARELTWGLPTVSGLVRRWRRRASAIADPSIRADALAAIIEQRGHIDGAALFSILPSGRHPALLSLLVAYEIIWDFLDNVNERTAGEGIANGWQLHQALVDAADSHSPPRDYYRLGPGFDDCGYLRALVATCQSECLHLRSRAQLRPSLRAEATRGQVCALNHEPDPSSRDAVLWAWAASELPEGHELSWFELTAAASTNLTVFALFALAAEDACAGGLIERTRQAYYPWISVLTALLDSYVDREEDVATGSHSYIAHYPSEEHATKRVCKLIRRCLSAASSLERSERHAVIAACMFTMYLSKDFALTEEMRGTTRRMLRSGGTLTLLLHPVLRLWRIVYGLRGA